MLATNQHNERSTAPSGHTSVGDVNKPTNGCSNTHRRNVYNLGGSSVHPHSLSLLCKYCQQSELYCRCLLDDDEPCLADIIESGAVLKDSILGFPIYDNQSGESNYNANVMMGSKQSTMQNVEFMDQNPSWGYEVESQLDPTFGAADQSDADLGSFFARPLKIFDVDWATTDANFGTTFNPWSLFFENPRVANRIANFNNARCKLHLKFVINGNGFHYGRALVSYSPLQNIDKTTPTRAFIAQDVIGASQKPHIYLDPTSSLGGEMILPFFWYNNALRIPTNDWQDMGAIDITAINQLKHANGATDQVRITVFAWAEDMVLSTPTNQNQSTLDPQAGEMMGGDEYGKKISGPATALAKAAGALSSIPGISLYARASQLALSTVADVASLFGYCRPVQDAPIVPYKPSYMGNCPQTNVPDSAVKLTTDLKQEVTIDPRTVGLSGMDELNIRSIVTRESFLTKFDWPVATQSGNRLATFGVTPMNWDEFNGGTDTEFHMTPACHVGCVFENWRGTMKYRFQIVASNFHKGRLQVQYDPYDSTDNEFNVAYNRVIDISEEKDFTIEVGWGIPETYAEVMNPGISGLNFRNSGDILPFPTNNPNFYNGQISIWVLNDLTVPNSEINNDIEINCFVSCGEDMEFANPSDEAFPSFVWTPTPPAVLEAQSGEEPLVAPDHDETEDPSRPVNSEPDMKVAGDSDMSNPMAMICFGENITSIRSLFKRFSLYSFYAAPIATATRTIVYRRRMMNFPLYRGYNTAGIHDGPLGKYNYVNATLINWFAPCFQGWRGGLRRKFQMIQASTPGGSSLQPHMSVTRKAAPGFGYLETAQPIFLTESDPDLIAREIGNFPLGFAGTQPTPAGRNPVLETEIPYHSNYRFHPTRELAPNGTLSVQFEGTHELRALDRQTVAEGGPAFVEYVAAGDDFSMFFYTNVPVCYYRPSNPF